MPSTTFTGQPPRKTVLRALRKLGWFIKRQGKGSHEIWQAPNGSTVSLPGDKYHNKPLRHVYIRHINAAMGNSGAHPCRIWGDFQAASG